MTAQANPSVDLKRYTLVTLAYWGLTLTDGALRMLVLLHFHQLGFNPLQLAFLFLLYEVMGVVTNLYGGYLGARYGLKITLFAGLFIQVLALMMLSFTQTTWAIGLSVSYVMASQALSGVAKDLTKMSSKSAVKLILQPTPKSPPKQSDLKSNSAPNPAPNSASNPAANSKAQTPSSTPSQAQHAQLFKWVALLTGSKNALKGVGFFLGGWLLTALGFQQALWLMAAGLLALWIIMLLTIRGDFGRSSYQPKFKQLLAKSRAINQLALARVFLFGARDVWFVVALPVFMHTTLGFNFTQTGAFMASWVIAYGFFQAGTPKLFKRKDAINATKTAVKFGLLLATIPAAIALGLLIQLPITACVLIGLGIFGIVFALNSSVHSYLILALTDEDQVALNVGFYYMANAIGRLLGTLLSGVVFLLGGLPACLWTSAAMLLIAALSLKPPSSSPPPTTT